MNMELYESLGLSPNEAKIYESLIEHGESAMSALAANAKIHRRNAYDAIGRLVEKGLVFEIFSSHETHYSAVSPEKLLEIVAERQALLEKELPELKRKYAQRAALKEAYIYKGLEGQKNIFRDMLRVGGDSYFIGAKGGWYDPRIQSARTAFFKQANKKKMRFIQLFDYETPLALPNFIKQFEGDLTYRILPKEFSTNSVIHIFGDYVITYTGLPIGKLPEDIVFFVLRSTDLAESYKKWFWCMWSLSGKNNQHRS